MSSGARAALLRVVMVTDGSADVGRIAESVREAVVGGVRAVQVREPELSAREVARLCERIAPDVRGAGGVLLVNDRADVAAAGFADGVHLGRRSLRAAQVRRFLPGAWIGVSAHDPDELARAREDGADFAFLSPVFPTASKPDAPALGVRTAADWTARAGLPVVWLGGVSADRLRDVREVEGLCGVAALSAFAAPARARASAEELVAAVDSILGESWTRSG